MQVTAVTIKMTQLHLQKLQWCEKTLQFALHNQFSGALTHKEYD